MAAMDWKAQKSSGSTGYEEFLVPAMFAPFAASLVEHAGVQRGSRVLDVACGTGIVSRTAARAAGAGGSVTGVDLGEPTLAVARSRPPEDGAAAIDYVQSDAEALPFEDAAFDVVLCQQGLQFFPDRAGALGEMHRVLKRGGRLAIATWKEIESTPFMAVAEALARHVGPDAAQMMHAPYTLDEGAELARLISEGGFHDVRVFDETIACTWASHSQFAYRAIAASPIAALFDGATAETQGAVAEEVTARLEPHAVADDRLSMAMTSNVALAIA
jgi:ubiquinone/menaquinone biosynthesis C-methylase UbiE